MTNKFTYLLAIIAMMVLYSCGEPNNPEDYSGGYNIINKIQTPGASNDLLVDGNTCYLTLGEAGILILDVSNPNSPNIIKHFSEGIRGYSTKIAKKDNIIYIAANTFGVSVVDVTDSANPNIPISNLDIKPSKNVYVKDGYLYTAISERGFNITDVNNPILPNIRAINDTDGYSRTIIVTADNSKLFAATGEVGLSVFDLSTFDNGNGVYPLLNSLNLEGYAEDVLLLENEQVALVACGNAGLQIIDYSNVNNLKLIGSISIGGYAKELAYQDGKVFMASGIGGLQIIDVSLFSNPILLGIVDTENATAITLVDNTIFIADKEEGLIIISK